MFGRSTGDAGATLVRAEASACGTGLEVRGRPVVRNSGELVIGDAVTIAATPASSHLVNVGRLHVGNNVVIAQGAAISCHERVVIEDDVVLGPFVAIMDSACRIGARVVVLPGAHIGAAAVVRAGSVVSGTVAPGAHVGGNPAAPLGAVEVRGGLGDARELVQRVFRLEGLPADTDGPDSIPGWDSLGALELLVELESALGRRLGDDEISRLRSVADVASLTAAMPTGSAAGRGEAVGAIIARVFGLDAAPPATARSDDIAGWDSLGTLELIIALETTFGVKIDERRLADVHTVGDLEDLVS